STPAGPASRGRAVQAAAPASAPPGARRAMSEWAAKQESVSAARSTTRARGMAHPRMPVLGHLTKRPLTPSQPGRNSLGQVTKSLATRRTFDEEVVLDAAAHVFRRRGYGGATVREVAQ